MHYSYLSTKLYGFRFCQLDNQKSLLVKWLCVKLSFIFRETLFFSANYCHRVDVSELLQIGKKTTRSLGSKKYGIFHKICAST